MHKTILHVAYLYNATTAMQFHPKVSRNAV